MKGGGIPRFLLPRAENVPCFFEPGLIIGGAIIIGCGGGGGIPRGPMGIVPGGGGPCPFIGGLKCGGGPLRLPLPPPFIILGTSPFIIMRLSLPSMFSLLLLLRFFFFSFFIPPPPSFSSAEDLVCCNSSGIGGGGGDDGIII